jgi:hypothetical protein
MQRQTQLKVYFCTSLRCVDYDCDYCPECSHAWYRGAARINGRTYEWDYNPHHGPIFACPSIGKRDWLPHQRHEVWIRFEEWRTRHFSDDKKPKDSPEKK